MPQKRTTPYHHGDLRKALLEGAQTLLEREGLSNLSLRAVAREAGVSSAAPYYHFKDKEGLLVTLATDAFRQFAATMRDHASRHENPHDYLHGLGVGYVVFASQHQALFHLMFAEHDPPPEIRDAFLEAGAESYHLLESAVKEVLHTVIDIPPKQVVDRGAALSWSKVHGIAMLVSDGAFTPDTLGYSSVEEMAFDLLKRGAFVPESLIS